MAAKGLYKIAYRPKQAPDKSKPWCIYNIKTDDINGRWHASKNDASDQLKAMYASMGSRAMMNAEHLVDPYLVDLRVFADTGKARWIDGTNQMWIQQYPFDSWDHPMYGTTTIGVDEASKLKDSFDAGVRGQRLFADYEHGMDVAKGGKAAGDILELKVITEPRGIFTHAGLWARVAFTDEAKSEIDSGAWNYWSTAHYDSWTHPQTGEKHSLVYDGGALTNKPYVKGMAPLNFSELGMTEDELKQFAVWSTAYVNNLPDSSFLYIEPGGKKNSDGKTEPLSLRHFPVKDANGNVDLAHVRNAIARAPQANVPPGVKAMVQAKARNLLNAKEHSELEAVMESPLDSFVEENQNEPEPDNNDEGGETVDLEQELRQLLNIGDDVNVVDHVKGMNDELTPLRDALKQHNERKAFAEAFPEEYERLQRLEAESQDNSAKRFSESYVDSRFAQKNGDEDVATTMGLSALSLDKVRDFAKKFSERTATLDGFKDVLDTIMGAGGIVDYGTKGSSREDENEHKEFNEQAAASASPQEVRKVFFDKVNEIAEKDELEFMAALEVATKTYPTLASAYRNAQPVK